MRFISTRSARLAGAAVAVTALTLGLAACAPQAEIPAGVDDLGTIKVGALQTPAGDILNFISEELAADAGLTIEFVPSIALSPNRSLFV